MFFRPWFFIVHFAVVARCNYTILSVRTNLLRVFIYVYVTIYMYMRACLRISICVRVSTVYLYVPVCASIFNRARV